MFKFNELKQIHLEITNNCQAGCPMCSRNVHGGLENPLLKIQNWSLDDFKNIMTEEVLHQIESYYHCGNFGDPLLNNNLTDMCEYSKTVAPDTRIAIHTNGSLRNPSWWKQLAKSLPKDHLVIFALDGLADTHSLYRIGTDYNKILENATAFIGAGGRADWTFIKFKHNEHQVEEARKIATGIGFEQFTVKNSSRFIMDPTYPVLDKDGNVTHHLKPSTDNTLKFIDKKMIDNAEQVAQQATINCFVQENKEIYIDAYKTLMPCCWLSSLPYTYITPGDYAGNVRRKILLQYYDLMTDLGGIDNMNALNRSVKDIVDSTEYQTVWHKYWNDTKLITCARTCGTIDIAKPKDQFREKEKINE
jgi:MoaA/NifB/PqqE/SkfB family radical SAM enzyme